MSELAEATREFLIESHENLNQLDLDLVGLEKSAAPVDALGRIFRALHTIKGSCSFLGFPHLEAVAHAGESLLGKLRDGKLALSPVITEGMLRMVDAIRGMLAGIESSGNDGNADHSSLIASLNRLATDQAGTIMAGSRKDLSPSQVDFEISAPSLSAVSEKSEESSVYDTSVRINVELLDKLMTVAGEIVLARNQILQFSQRFGEASFHNTCRQLNLITTELQEHVMKTRLQPLGNVWNRFPRLVHDTAHACGKKVRLEMTGSETELDKTLIEAVRDPLTHLVRNAIDHGIEAPERRRAAGKPEEGCVRLRAYHEGGQVNVEISDDGSGIDPDRIKHKAVEQHLVTAEQAARMGTQTVLGLIFLPGFSTAAQVTTLSGRGVGMDVVKTNIEKIGGSVDISSTVGKGTTVRLRIPLTLAIIKVLVVTSAGDRYAIPQVSLVELLRLESGRGVELFHDAPVYRLRGNLLPLVYLDRELTTHDSPLTTHQDINIVVLRADDRQFGLVVDAIHDTEEIVVKPLQKQLKGISAFSGATIMGDGKVALILDVLGLAQRAKVTSGARDSTLDEQRGDAALASVDRQTVVLFATHDGGRMGVPLSLIDRLEEFPCSMVERIGTREVVQYRGEILPLLHVSEIFGGVCPTKASEETVQVVVFAGKTGRVGLVVDRILDIVEEAVVSRSNITRPGVVLTAVIQGRVTEILDVETLLRSAEPEAVEA